MAQRSCCVPGCSVKLGDGVLLHRFPNPSNPAQIERFRTWVMKIGGDIIGEDNSFIYRNRKVCHRHFEDIYIFPNRKLTSLAIPSMHIPRIHTSEPKICVSQTPEPAVECGTKTNLGLPSISAQMDTYIPLEMDVCKVSLQKSHTTELPNMVTGGNIELPSTSVQDNSSILALSSTSAQVIPSKTDRNRISSLLIATEKCLANIIPEAKMKLPKSQIARHKLEMQLQMADKMMKSSAYNTLKENK